MDVKMMRDSLVRAIVNGDDLSYSALFISYKEYQRLLSVLGCLCELSMDEISKITYKGKTLYEKEEMV